MEQMLDAIKSVGLEPELVAIRDVAELREYVYAYLHAGIPLLLGGKICDSRNPDGRGKHAVAITGYGIGETSPASSGLLSRSHAIDRLYCHDDQVGPFARMVLTSRGQLSTSWPDGHGPGTAYFEPSNLLMPLYHKIRLPLAQVLKDVRGFDSLGRILASHNASLFPRDLTWEIVLTCINEYKATIGRELDPGQVRRSILETPMPRFIWRARAAVENRAMVDLLFDATDIELGNSCFCAVEHDSCIGNVLRSLAAADRTAGSLRNEPWRRTVEAFLRPRSDAQISGPPGAEG